MRLKRTFRLLQGVPRLTSPHIVYQSFNQINGLFTYVSSSELLLTKWRPLRKETPKKKYKCVTALEKKKRKKNIEY